MSEALGANLAAGETSSPAPATRQSFRRQLFLAFSVGMLALALTASLTTSWVTGNRVRDLALAQGLQVTENLARQSVLALLYGAGENVRDSVNATLAFPGVEQVAVYDLAHEPLLESGSGALPTLDRERLDWSVEKPAMVREVGEGWHFMAPVYTPQESEVAPNPLYATDRQPRELLGHVYVAVSKANLKQMQDEILINNITIAVVIAVVFLLLLHLILRHLTRPLMALAGVMQRAEQGETGMVARAEGPQEVARIAYVFNSMMLALEERDRRLRQQNETLESQVALRTRELVAARDMALDASRHKSEFLANITHELRTPMQAIIGYTDVVTEALEDEGLEEYVADMDQIQRSAQRLLKLINEVLDLAKIEAGRMELNPEPVDLRELAAEAEGTVAPIAREHGNTLAVEVDAYGPQLRLDRDKLLQVLINLMSNAAKFTEGGEITVTLRSRPYRLICTVRDTGIGMSEAQQRLVFEPFRQADHSATRQLQGTGLGLAITRQLCELMGGDIAVSSRPGAGTTFTVTIPLGDDGTIGGARG